MYDYDDNSSSSDSDERPSGFYRNALLGLSQLTLTRSPTATNTDLLFEAIRDDDILQVSYVMTLEPFLEAIDKQPSPLWMAIHKSTPEIVDVLIRGGCDIKEMQRPSDYYQHNCVYNYFGDRDSFSDYSGYSFHTKMTLIHWAILNRSYDKVRVLLAHGGSPNWVDARYNSVLQYAVESGNVRIAKELIKQGANINQTLNKFPGNMVIHDAVSYSNIPMVKMLLSYGANPRAKNLKGQTLLHVLTISPRRENPELAKILLAAGSQLDDQYKDEETPLFLAIKLNLIETAKVLLSHNANPNVVTMKFEFPLLLAVRRGCSNLTALVLSKGAWVNQRTETGQTALHVACTLEYGSIASLLISYGADVNASDNEGNTPLHMAVRTKKTVITSLILNHKAKVNAKDSRNCTPLHIAAETGIDQLVKMLLDFGADPLIVSGNGENALHFGSKAENENLVLIRRLLDAGISVKQADSWGYTPLHVACLRGKESLAKLFLKQGADINSKTKRHECPLHLSVKRGSIRLVEHLLQHGAEVNGKAQFSETAIYTACRYEHADKIKLLLDYGADISVKDEVGLTPFCWLSYKGEKAGKIMMKQMALLTVARRFVEKLDLRIVNGALKTQQFFRKAIEEVEKMKKDTFFGDVTFFDVLNTDTMELLPFLRNKNFTRAFRKEVFKRDYPLYGDDLIMKFDRLVNRKELLNAAERYLTFALGMYIPVAIIERMAVHIMPEDLEDKVFDESLVLNNESPPPD